VQRLCRRSLAFKQGKLVEDGDTRDVVALYLSDAAPGCMPGGWIETTPFPRQIASGAVRVAAVSYTGAPGVTDSQPQADGPLTVKLLLESDADLTLGSVAVTISDQLGTKLVNADSIKLGKSIQIARGRTIVTVEIASLHLTSGSYILGWWIADPIGTVHDYVERSVQIEVADVVEAGLGIRPHADGAVTAAFDIETESTP
jgi:lipopolysaccharide transport system ATP-binding protein